MKLRSLCIFAALATFVVVLSCSGADGIPGPSAITPKSDSTLLAGLNVSGQAAKPVNATDRGAAGPTAALNVEVSYVSLVPGTIADGTSAMIANLRTAQRVTVPIVDGGFDPQPIPANLGDTLRVTVSRTGHPETVAYMAVAGRLAPRIVRTRPPRGQTDAPLNTIITLVFSEPLDPASVNPSSVMLTTAGSPVAGAVHILPGPGYTIEFTPSTLLAPLTTYSLTVSGVATLAGTPLDAPTSIAFTTGGPTREISVSSSFLAQGPVTGGGYALPASVPITWRSSDPSVATVEPWGDGTVFGKVVGIRPGTTVIEGSALGATATTVVTVLATAPASTVSPVIVGFRMLEVRYNEALNFWSYAPDIVLVDTTGRGGSAVLKVSFDLPGLGRSPTCYMDRGVPSAPMELFHESYGDFELTISGGGGQRAGAGEAVAHITLSVPGPAAMTFDVSGPIVPGSFPTTYTGGGAGFSCGL